MRNCKNSVMLLLPISLAQSALSMITQEEEEDREAMKRRDGKGNHLPLERLESRKSVKRESD